MFLFRHYSATRPGNKASSFRHKKGRHICRPFDSHL